MESKMAVTSKSVPKGEKSSKKIVKPLRPESTKKKNMKYGDRSLHKGDYKTR